MTCITEKLEGGRVIITGPNAGAVQFAIEQTMDRILNGTATFTYPVRQADGQYIATGKIIECTNESDALA